MAEPAPILRFARSALSPDTVWSLLTVMEKKQEKIHALMQGQTVNFPTPVAASVLNAGNLPARIASRASGIVTRATGNGGFPVNVVTRPVGVVSLPATIDGRPVDIVNGPASIASLPAGIDCRVLTIETFPASHKSQKTRVLAGF